MSISLDEVRHVAKLARLKLDESELVQFQSELNGLLGHFQDIQSLAFATPLQRSAGHGLVNIWSEDEVEMGLERADALRNAPVSRAGLFIVPTIIEE